MKKCLTLSAMVGLVACWLTSSALAANVVVNDTWQSGDRNEPAPPQYVDPAPQPSGDTRSAWFAGGGGSLDPVGPGGPLRGEVEPTSSSSWTTYFAPDGQKVSLNNPGDRLTLTWVFSLENVNPDHTGQSFRLAVVNTYLDDRVAGEDSPGASSYPGYAMFGNMISTTFNRSNPLQMRRWGLNFPPTTGSDLGNQLSTSGVWDTVANNPGDMTGAEAYLEGVEYTFTFDALRTASDELDVTMRIEGGNIGDTGALVANYLDASPLSFDFDTFAIRPSRADQAAEVFDTHLFRVEFVPEPTSLALFGMSLAVVALRRQR